MKAILKTDWLTLKSSILIALIIMLAFFLGFTAILSDEITSPDGALFFNAMYMMFVTYFIYFILIAPIYKDANFKHFTIKFSFPIKRSDYIICKYILFIVLTLFINLVYFTMIFILNNIMNININISFNNICFTTLSITVYFSLFFMVLSAFESSKCMKILSVFLMIFILGPTLIPNVPFIRNLLIYQMTTQSNTLGIIYMVIALIILPISCILSMKFMSYKDI